MRRLLTAMVLGPAMVALASGGFAYAKSPDKGEAHPHAAAHVEHPPAAAHVEHSHVAVEHGFHGFAHPGFGARRDWDWRADRWHHHARWPYIVFGVLSTLVPPPR